MKCWSILAVLMLGGCGVCCFSARMHMHIPSSCPESSYLPTAPPEIVGLPLRAIPMRLRSSDLRLFTFVGPPSEGRAFSCFFVRSVRLADPGRRGIVIHKLTGEAFRPQFRGTRQLEGLLALGVPSNSTSAPERTVLLKCWLGGSMGLQGKDGMGFQTYS